MDQQFSDELTDLLTKLKKGHSWYADRVLNLSDAERDIFMEASAKESKVRKSQFTEMIKGK